MRFGIVSMIFAVAIVLLAKPPLYAFLVVGLIVFEAGSYTCIMKYLREKRDQKIAELLAGPGAPTGTQYPDVGV